MVKGKDVVFIKVLDPASVIQLMKPLVWEEGVRVGGYREILLKVSSATNAMRITCLL